jgi:riboflavin transporter FmnP
MQPETIIQSSPKWSTKKIAVLAMLSAIATVLDVMFRIPIVPAVGFIGYEPKDVILTIGAFLYGPAAGAAMAVVASFAYMFIAGQNALWGALMNIVSSCAFVCTAAFIYKKWRSLTGAAIGLVSAVIVATAVMLLWNYALTPYIMGVPRERVVQLLIPGFLPFNLVKGGLNATLTMMLYKPVRITLDKARLLPVTRSPAASSSRVNIGVLLASAFVFVTCVLFILSRRGII